MSEAFVHRPVLGREVVELLSPVPAGTVVDATIGGGGHAGLLLEARPDLRILGIDRDDDALTAAAHALERFGDRVQLVRAEFSAIASITTGAAGTGAVREGDAIVGVLFDLGVSSPQLDRSERGFSYWADAPLDMRMDARQELTAAEVVNAYSEAELAGVIAEFGEERFARRVAAEIVRRRPLTTTGDLVDAIKDAIPAPARRRGGHPARRTFQAIRMEVNRELPNLREGLEDSVHLLTPGGRVLVLAYHSLEDRIVKRRFADWSGTAPAASGPRGLPVETPETPEPPLVRLITRKPIRPTEAELGANPRSASVRLRGGAACVSTGTAAAPHRIPRRPAPARPRPEARTRHLQLVDTERRRREQRRRWIVRVWAVGIVAAALVGVMVHAFMAEGQLRADELEARIEREQTRYADARLDLARREAPRVIAARAARLGLVPGSGTLTVAVPGVAPGSPEAPTAATEALQAVKRVLDGAP